IGRESSRCRPCPTLPNPAVGSQARRRMTSSQPSATRLSSERLPRERSFVMAESVYKVIELVGTSTESWEKAAMAAGTTASKTLRDLRIAEVTELDLQLEDGKVRAYRAKLKVSFKYED